MPVSLAARRYCLFLAAPLLAAGSVAWANTYSLGIQAPHGESTIAYDINAAGQVAADLRDSEGREHAVLFHRGVLTKLGTLGGEHSNIKAINDHGQVVGSAQNASGRWRAFLYTLQDGMRDLGTLGGPSSYGQAINAAGEVAGFADTADGHYRAFHYRASAMRDLGTLGGKISFASGINDKGQIVGTAETAEGLRHAFVYDEANGMRDLGTLGGLQSSASAINDAGVIVGVSQTASRRWHAFVIENGKMIDLGAKIGFGNSFATAINNAGHVVGTVIRGDERMSFVWRDGRMLVHPGGHGLFVTNGINEAEQVVGAVGGSRLVASAMHSSATPVVAGTELRRAFILLNLMTVLAIATVVYRRRYRGLSSRDFTL